MKKEYTLKGMDCASCATKIESVVKKLDGVSDASVNFVTSTLKVEVPDEKQAALQQVGKAISKVEPNVTMAEKKEKHSADDGHDHDHGGDGKRQLIMLLVGAAIFVVGMVLEYGFSVNEYFLLGLFIVGYIILGGEIVLRALKNITRGQIFDENFLMSIATIGAFIIGDAAEAVGVMLFFQVGEYFQALAVRRSKKSITDLMDIRPDFANVKRNGQVEKVAPETVEIGDIIVVKPGEKIPLDGVVIEGEAMLDTKALTGESVPRKAKVDDEVLSGCINQNGVLTIKVTKSFGQSTVAKIIDLVENASSNKAPTENFMTTFSRYYTPVVVALAALIAVIPPLFFNGLWAEWVNRGLIFLVISCPCALVVSIPLGFFGGIGGASKRGVLVKGSNYLEALGNLDVVVFDKTGTLTKGVFKVTKLLPANGFTNEQLLEAAANAEVFSNHPIALSIMTEYGKAVEKETLSDYNEISGHGISVNAGGKVILAGNHRLMNLKGVSFNESGDIGTKVYVAVDNMYAGCVVISDEVKEDSRNAIVALKERGVRKTVMLTGDNPQIAEAIAKELKLDEFYGGLLPENKVEKVEMLDGQKSKNKKLAFVGDGINDAPVLARADVGIAMGGLGSDAAIEAADVVLMTDEPSKLADAIDIARFTKRIVWQNIILALGVKGIFLLLGAMGLASMWEAVFADVGVTLLAVFNAMRVIRKK
ncbi:heavy metal translocating P-type ATPase [Lacrimispora sp.]|uniref:heavy metal translocating P-type ATPase n=1 Tax=Lacrimispora sp. TaxID=2719234 RepID=UPI0029E16745|nr:Zn2+/Cd2+-exporting ATPase [Lacrimispora sp.]